MSKWAWVRESEDGTLTKCEGEDGDIAEELDEHGYPTVRCIYRYGVRVRGVDAILELFA